MCYKGMTYNGIKLNSRIKRRILLNNSLGSEKTTNLYVFSLYKDGGRIMCEGKFVKNVARQHYKYDFVLQYSTDFETSEFCTMDYFLKYVNL
jgi:hypothetical protein